MYNLMCWSEQPLTSTLFVLSQSHKMSTSICPLKTHSHTHCARTPFILGKQFEALCYSSDLVCRNPCSSKVFFVHR